MHPAQIARSAHLLALIDVHLALIEHPPQMLVMLLTSIKSKEETFKLLFFLANIKTLVSLQNALEKKLHSSYSHIFRWILHAEYVFYVISQHYKRPIFQKMSISSCSTLYVFLSCKTT